LAYQTVRRAYPGVEHVAFVPHTPLRGDRWTGVLHLLWHISRESPVVIGSGRYEVREPATAARPVLGPRRRGPLRAEVTPPEVAAQIVRRGETGPPVLPGSSIKGAVRQAFELLTPSCQPGGRESCKVRPKDKDQQIQVCRACSLFGAPGLGGRLAVGEATPAEGWQSRLAVRKVPIPWAPRVEVPGSIKFYDPAQALTRDGRPAPPEEPTWTVWGDFASRVRLINAEPEELGLVFAALGLGVAGPSVRLGGRKYHGLGAAVVAITSADQMHPERRSLDRPAAEAWVREHLDRWVLDVEERRRAWDDLHRVLQGS
jgi:hypothetical protein